MTFMKAEPGGASDAKRMMVGEAAPASGTETAPGTSSAAAANKAIKVLCNFVITNLSSRGSRLPPSLVETAGRPPIFREPA